jgi:hypothetical protein
MKHGHLERSWQEHATVGGSVKEAAVFPSPSGEYKAVVMQASDGLLRVGVFQHFYDEDIDECYWQQVAGTPLTDTLESATKLAQEALEGFRHRKDFI